MLKFVSTFICLLFTLGNFVYGFPSREDFMNTWCGDESCYKILGVEEDCSPENIINSYRLLARKLHPDKNRDNPEKAEKLFREVARAYEILNDASKRNTYDEVRRLKMKMFVPKENPFIVLFFVILAIFGMIWFYEISNQKNKRKMLLTNNAIVHRLKSKLQAEGKAARIKNNILSEDISDELLTEVVQELKIRVVGGQDGKKPDFWSIVKNSRNFPFKLCRNIFQSLRQLIMYTLLKREFSEQDKIYLTLKHLEITQYDWDQLPANEKEKYIKQKLWSKSGSVNFKGNKLKQK